ncbi:alpha-glucosidase [Nocardioides luteus]|uniref:Glucohydrolase n=1 Tax=Nocardioides luteus TaxID=1844 RepID=A0A1J4N1X7_9ACTN|nr:alpha-glucosidase [Nocardioides luteus]OIJ25563.1 glucohydrolase [Nocardioides luteus]
MAAPGTPRSASNREAWWKSAVVYQIYVRSFADSDDDGIGDLPGIVQHLDYLQELGIDVIWLSPVYRSPQEDNGYDVSDYQDVDPLFGTLEDLDRLLDAVHRRGMRLIMDLVVNHTSDQHPWFLAARASREAATSEWYFWRDARPGTIPGAPGSEPNNWGASFGGSAWEWAPERGQYYLHLFARSQPDLNWDNPDTREAVFTMMNWWLDRGIDGFRMDVINFISKDPRLPDAPLNRDGYGDGMPYFGHGPRIRDYLAEMKRRVFDSRPGSYLTVGEMPGVTPEQAREFTHQVHGQLAMVFQYEHVNLDADGDKWTQRRMSVKDLRDTLARWQTALGDTGWNSLYWNNHDQPRVVSRYGNDTTYWRESATALATVLHLHRGTPYVFQGEEIGMTNAPFTGIDDFRDIESLDYYARAVGTHRVDAAVALDTLRRRSRDNARTPMQWSAAPGAGFTPGTAWIGINPNHSWLNVAAQRGAPGSVYEYYRALIALRHHLPVVVDGHFAAVDTGRDQIYSFRRQLDGTTLTVDANLSDLPVSVDRDDRVARDLVLANYPRRRIDPDRLEPWEVRVYAR